MVSTKTAERLSQAHSIRLIEVVREVGIANPKFLTTRRFGENLHAFLRDRLNESLPGTVVTVDFKGVTTVSGSFADAAFASLAMDFSRGDFPDRFVVLENLQDDPAFTLDSIIKGRPDREGKLMRNLVLAALDESGRVGYLGKIEGHLLPAFDSLSRTGRMTARQLSKDLNLELNAASSKLKALYDLRLVWREEQRDEQGKQFVYQTLV